MLVKEEIAEGNVRDTACRKGGKEIVCGDGKER